MCAMNLDYDPMSLLPISKFCKCKIKSCSCGEATNFEWTWDDKLVTTTAELSPRNLEVTFHPGYSNGTAAVRGNRHLERGRHHYWEVKMVTPVYGTDVMIGVGTEKAILEAKNKFCSLLGMNKESWGFSYKGEIQYGGKRKEYSTPFGQGSLVGVHLDTWQGTLQFFVNRKPLGTAFIGLQNLDLYPMVSSTAAKSMVRITQCLSTPASLQMECLRILNPMQRSYLSTAFPGLKYLSQSMFADILKKDQAEEDDDFEYEFPKESLILDDFDFALVGCGRRRKKPKLCS